MVTRVGNLSKKTIGVTGKQRKQPLCYGDIDGRPLQLPSLVFPFRRAIYFVSKTAYENAIASSRPHACATASYPSKAEWGNIQKIVSEESESFDVSSVDTA